jgi:hypothetical protein
MYMEWKSVYLIGEIVYYHAWYEQAKIQKDFLSIWKDYLSICYIVQLQMYFVRDVVQLPLLV